MCGKSLMPRMIRLDDRENVSTYFELTGRKVRDFTLVAWEDKFYEGGIS